MLYKSKIALNVFILTGACWRLDQCGMASFRGLRKTMLNSTQFWIRKEIKTGGVGSCMNSKSLCSLLFSFNKTNENRLPVEKIRYSKSFPDPILYVSAVARPDIGEKKERGGVGYTVHIHCGKFKVKLIELELSVNGMKLPVDWERYFFQPSYIKIPRVPKFSLNIDRAKLD